MLFEKLNKDRIGEMALRLPLASLQANHKRVQYTVKDYISPGENDLEGQFVRDLFVLTTDEIIEKWFDGKDEALNLLMNLMQQ
ncbi:hypothetical protein [Sporosarcina sp. FSL K6-1508]|uniref:hypothetical protein n=1 Tax=Sporosarcina sp. FSL K6-1508 TaxID=2921553 RepID=UPI0030F93D8E